ncbi:MAG TPA: hypothetical protein VKY85_06940 [Candidatus Angelobacter sp.]|nr:hypothetical protein [Candidatus Angelobacter sp.]
MYSDSAEAITLLKAWYEDSSWIYMQTCSGISDDEQQFWGQVQSISDAEVRLAGEDIALLIPLEDSVFEHVSAQDIPEIVRARFKDTDCCLFIRSERGAALLYGRKSRVGFVNTFRPRSATYA